MSSNKLCCISCKKEYTVSGFRNHFGSKSCKKVFVEKNYQFSKVENNFKCDLCSYTTEYLSKIKFHCWKSHTKEGINHNPKIGKKGGNQFTKGIQKNHSSETKFKIGSKSKGRNHSSETKEKISKIRIKYLTENPDKVPYLMNHSSKPSFPEEYFKDIFENEFGSEVKFEYRIGRYRLDIAFPNSKINIEIDGEQHYLDKRILKSDIRRTAYLEQLGWKSVRIRWSIYQRLDKLEKEEFIKSLWGLCRTG